MIIFALSMKTSKKYFCKKYGILWFMNFKKISKENLDDISKRIPKIGNSIFSMNYKFAPIYIAWYKAFEELKIEPNQIDKEIWVLNENLMNIFPKFLLKLSGKIYLNGFRKRAKNHVYKQNLGKLHPHDWKINFKDVDSNSFEINITECAYKKLAEEFNVKKMLPGICRMDYLMANLMGNGFQRTKTLGDGDNCCNCRYEIIGDCEWSPEKGFINRR